MSKLTPEQIFNNYKNGELNKTTALNYLRDIVENSNNNALRIECLMILDNINLEASKVLNFLENLIELDLYGNNITEIKGLDSLKNLKTLILGGNIITEIKGLEHLENLEYLNLGGNIITEIKGLSNLKKLRHLDLESNYIDKKLIESHYGLDELTNLEQFKHGKQKLISDLEKNIEILNTLKIKRKKSEKLNNSNEWIPFNGF